MACLGTFSFPFTLLASIYHNYGTADLARNSFKIKYKLMTTDAVYDKETLIASHLKRQRQLSANQDQVRVG
jgi:hypothetical protein